MNPTVLVVEDDRAFAYALAERLEREGLEVVVAATAEEALEQVGTHAPALAIVDYRLPGLNGAELVQRLVDGNEHEPVASIMITAFGSIDGAIEAMRAGCMDYVTKGSDLDEIAIRVRKSLELLELRGRVQRYEQALARQVDDGGILGKSPPIEALREQIRVAAAASDTTVLVLGESGTGKQLVARAIQAGSERRNSPFVEVDCTTLTAGLFESELFGHERGAFTGANQRKQGLVEMAAGGTLFLDEIGELEASMQSKLLRLLQERRFRRVGGLRDRSIDVRVIAATNRDLEAEIAAGRFREDLYYRLLVFQVSVPPLRERGEDVLLLADEFLREFARKFARPGLTLTAEARARLREHPLPGNVRQLRALVEQAVLRSTGDRIDADLFEDGSSRKRASRRRAGRPPTRVSLEEARQIRAAMERYFGNQSKAAAALGISRFALRRKLKQLLTGR